MDPEQLIERGMWLIQEFAPMRREDIVELPSDIAALKLWAKVRAANFVPQIKDSQEAQAAIVMAIETAWLLGRRHSEDGDATPFDQ